MLELLFSIAKSCLGWHFAGRSLKICLKSRDIITQYFADSSFYQMLKLELSATKWVN